MILMIWNSGKIRCWCHGRSNCNTPEDSKALYEAFISDSIAEFNQVIEEIDSSPSSDDYSDVHSERKTTTKPPAIFRVPIVAKYKNSTKKVGNDPKSKDVYFVAKPEAGHTDNQEHKLRHHHHHHKSDETKKQTNKSTKTSHDYGTQMKSQDENYSNQKKSKNENYDIQMKAKIQDNENQQNSAATVTEDSGQKAKIHLDDNNEIHVIHVKPEEKNKYERIVASDEFGKIVKKVTPTEATSDDLYDEEELARLDAEFIERKKQNRPKPKEPEVIRVLPQEDLDLDPELDKDMNKDLEQVTGEYFDAAPTDLSTAVSFSIGLIFSVIILFVF